MKQLLYPALAAFSLILFSSFSEDDAYYIPQAPDAQAVARAIDIPVNKYTGIPDISIPLYEIKVGPVTVPISLSYHAGGILASQEATEVGLGWSLNAGGMITRTVKCADDFLEHSTNGGLCSQGYFDYQQDWNENLGTLSDYVDYGNGYLIKDTEPDVYYFHTSSASGKMWFDHQRNPHYVDPSLTVKVSIGFGNILELTDAQGVRYIFSKKEETRSFVTNTGYGVNTQSGGYDITVLSGFSNWSETTHHTSSWKLSTIVTPQNDSVRFEYEEEYFQLPIQESSFKSSYYTHEGDLSAIGSVPGSGYSTRKTIVYGWRLSRIVWKGGSVELDAESRNDILGISSERQPKRISAIRILDNASRTVKSFGFQYSYFNPNAAGQYAHLFKRLKLESIVDSLQQNAYHFTYNEEKPLPVKNTKNTDYWGYPNGSVQKNNYVCRFYYNGKFYKGGDKEANENYSQLGILKTLQHPTGGVTNFTYENNRASGEYYRSETHVNSQAAYYGTDEDELASHPNWMESDTIAIGNTAYLTITNTLYNVDNVNVGYGYYNTHFISDDPPFAIYTLADNGNITRCVFRRDIPTESQFWGNSIEYIYPDTMVVLTAGRYVIQTKAVYDGFTAFMSISSEIITCENGDHPVGGLRIASIEGETRTDYQYEGGKQLITPVNGTFDVYGKIYNSTQSPTFVGFLQDLLNFAIIADAFRAIFPVSLFLGSSPSYNMQQSVLVMLTQHSESVRPLSTFTNGNITGYSTVREIFQNGSSNAYFYHNEEEPDRDYLVPTSPSIINWENGLLLDSKRYGTNNKLFQHTTFEYLNYDLNDSIKGFTHAGSRGLFKYCQNVHCPKLIQKTDSLYENNICHVTNQYLAYNDRLQCIGDSISVGNESRSTRYWYASDLNDTISHRLVSENRVGFPVVTLEARNGNVYAGTRTQYGDFNGMLLPKYLQNLNTGQASYNPSLCRFDTIVEYTAYNRYGNPQELIVNGMPVTCLWGYKGQYPIAEYRNATMSSLSAGGLNANTSLLLEDEDLTAGEISALRNVTASANAPIAVTTCRYQPLIGVTEIKDPAGLNRTYRYDAAGRLSQTLFGSNELHGAFGYHYATASDTLNYVRTTEYLDYSHTDSICSIQYYDRWGRASVSSATGINTTGTPLYALQTYDAMGRPDKTWTAVPSSVPLAAADFPSASASAFGGDTYGYVKNTYDARGRIAKATIPGSTWHTNNKATVYAYSLNTNNAVKRYRVSNNQLSQDGCYPKGTLTCETVTDADGNSVKTYKDLFGNVVMERKGTNVDTYYVYDDCNRLRYVLSPMYQQQSDAGKYAYEYRYDGKGRIVYKKIPGCDPVTYEYDRAGRIIRMQDGILSQAGKSRTYSYDGLGRMTSQSIRTGNQTVYDEVRNYYDNYDFENTYSAMLPGEMDRLFWHDEDYCKNRLTGTWQRASNGDTLLTTFGYDDHGRLYARCELGLDQSLSVSTFDYNFTDDLTSEYYEEYILDETTQYLELAFDGYIDNFYDLPHTKLLHTSVISLFDDRYNTSGFDTISHFTYDAFGRIVRNERDGSISDMTYEYDNLHGWLTHIKGANHKLQHEQFEQWLYREDATEPRYNGSISSMMWRTDNSIVRRYDYQYDNLNRMDFAEFSNYVYGGATVQPELYSLIPYNDSQYEYYTVGYVYDRNTNITQLTRYGKYYSGLNYNDVSYKLLDDLEITYNGNQRVLVEDFGMEPENFYGDFSFGAGGDAAYEYDANGSLVEDGYKGLTYSYDLLGHPLSVVGQYKTIGYVYAADGRKLRTTYRTKRMNQWIETKTDYRGRFIYENGDATMCRFDGGYIGFKDDEMNGCYYYIKDYQGNNRMVVKGSQTIDQVNHYYPDGSLMGEISIEGHAQKFRFGGKELEKTCGLNLYDFHARQYDPQVPAFTSIDPLAEDEPSISPYAYCAGDPVNFIDPTGMKPDSLEAAMMSNHVYEGSGELSGGWICNYLYSNPNNGLKYGIYSRLKENGTFEYALVFAGTKITDPKDLQTDKDQYMGKMDEWFLQDNGEKGKTQYGEALTESKRFLSAIEGSEGTILGHSLGGGLATVGSLATGLPAMTFNPAGVHKNTINRLGLQNANSSQITNYVIAGEIVSVSNMLNPNIINMGTTYYYLQNPIILRFGVLGSCYSHFISNFIK